MYTTNVKSIGNEAQAFSEEKMVILFGEQAPSELIDYCYIIEVNELTDEITEKNKVIIDNQEFAITKVGSAVNKNLAELGHITIKFDGSEVAEQSGTLYLEDGNLPTFEVGTVIKIN